MTFHQVELWIRQLGARHKIAKRSVQNFLRAITMNNGQNVKCRHRLGVISLRSRQFRRIRKEQGKINSERLQQGGSVLVTVLHRDLHSHTRIVIRALNKTY